MRYINEINSFCNWLIFNTISTNAQALWYALMHFNNKCPIEIDGEFYWRVRFKAPGKSIKALTGFEHDMQLKRARDELISAGRIRYTNGTGSSAGMYELIPFETSIHTATVRELLDKMDNKREANVRQSVRQSLALIDLDLDIYINNNIYNYYFCDDVYITRAHETKGEDNSPMAQMSEYFGMTEQAKNEFKQTAVQLFKDYFDRKALPDDVFSVFQKTYTRVDGRLTVDEDKLGVLQYAFEQASKASNPHWFYINGVLENLRRRSLTTYDACVDYDASRDFERDRRNSA